MDEEFEFIEFICRLNGYPEGFIKSQIRKTLSRYFDKINGTQLYKSEDKKMNNKENKYKVMQYFPEPHIMKWLQLNRI
jgi:hypothetical protein